MFGVTCIFILFMFLLYQSTIMASQERVSVDDLVTQSLIITIFELMFAIVFYITASYYF